MQGQCQGLSEEGRYSSNSLIVAKLNISTLLLSVIVPSKSTLKSISNIQSQFLTEQLPASLYHDCSGRGHFLDLSVSLTGISVTLISMEPRSSKREQRGQAHEPSSNRKSERHRLSETEKRASADPRRRSTQHELPKESLKPALSGDDDYVRRWLAQTDKEIDLHVNKARTQEKKAG